MQPQAEPSGELTWRAAAFINPVFAESFPDPFVLKHRGEYFAYCTGFTDDGKVFGVLRSTDLVSWTKLGGAMAPLDPTPPFYWAPEVTYDNGKFYMYYSVGNETFMEIRVAVSDYPAGGFVDAGHRLTTEEFAIDAHVFIDTDRTKYLFYATDFLEHTHIGTGTVVDRMIDWFTLEGNPRPVTRAKYDWQVYDPERKEKGGVRWHTVEGPAVLKRKGKYFEMFSGGNWKNTTYGVSFATTDDIHSDNEWSQFSDGEKVLPILRTIPDRIIGPGHNCIVRGPNGRELYCVYHRWTDNGRVMAIDRMDFAGDRMFVIGATDTPQPDPFQPSQRDLSSVAASVGDWKLEYSDLVGTGELKFEQLPESCLLEFTFRCSGQLNEDGKLAVLFKTSGGEFELTIHPLSNVARLNVPVNSPGLPSIFKLADTDWTVPHTLRIDHDHRRIQLSMDNIPLNGGTFLDALPTELSLIAEHLSVAISAFTMTEGFEETFVDEVPLEENGWQLSGDGGHRPDHREVVLESDGECFLKKGGAYESLEFAANFRLIDTGRSTSYGIVLRAGDDELSIEIDPHRSVVRVGGARIVDLGNNVDVAAYHQLRAVKIGGDVLCYFDEILLGEFRLSSAPTTASVLCRNAKVAIEMIRLTRI